MVIAKENNFKQAGERWRSFDAQRRDRFIERLVGWLLDPRCEGVWVYVSVETGV